MGLMESVCSVELQCEDTDYLTHLVFKMLHISIHCELSYMSLCECCATSWKDWGHLMNSIRVQHGLDGDNFAER